MEQLIRASAADTPNPFRYMLQGNFTIAAETNAVRALPAEMRQQISVLQQDGFIKADNKGLSSNLQLQSGQLTANGKNIPLGEFKLQNK